MVSRCCGSCVLLPHDLLARQGHDCDPGRGSVRVSSYFMCLFVVAELFCRIIRDQEVNNMKVKG